MNNSVQVTGKGMLDTEQRTAALQALQDGAETAELVKLQSLMKNPALRSMLKNF